MFSPNDGQALSSQDMVQIHESAKRVAKSSAVTARFLPQLLVRNDLVIDYLAQGRDYDLTSVERAVHEGNMQFEKGIKIIMCSKFCRKSGRRTQHAAGRCCEARLEV